MDDCIIPIEVDTGASMSLMSESIFGMLWPGRSTDVRLQSYSKANINTYIYGFVHAYMQNSVTDDFS